jgi:type I restriction enzyme R subunit
MSIGGERPAVQNPFIDYAVDAGWKYLPSDEVQYLRGGNEGILLREFFHQQVMRLNPDFMTSDLAEELAKRIERVPPSIEGNLIAWEHLKGVQTVFVPEEKRERNVRLIDTDHLDRNTFHVTDEFSFTNGSKTIRADVVLIVNGIPVFFVETKAAHKTEGIADALDQVRRYHRECPELLAILQLYALTHIVHYYYSATWNVSKKSLFNWKDEVHSDYEGLVKSFCNRELFISLLTDYILFTRQDDELQKVVLRPHQARAVERIVDRAASPGKRSGLIWHTQGSGKTYTMIVAAQQILANPAFENPTVLMLVDRNELESQLFGNLSAAGITRVEVAQTKEHLRDLFSRDQRGLIVSMIHKFEGMPADISRRENIIVLVDEAHRTTGGKLGNYLMGALPNATYIGFTGTPIDRTQYGKGTFITFGKDDPPRGYLDKYGIAESIEDGTTVPLHYALAPNELQVDRATLEREFLDLKEAQGVSDIAELNRVLEKAVNLRNMLKNAERVERVAQYIADHYRNTVEPLGYKAFLVAVDREACALYKNALDALLPPEYSEVVYSRGPNDDEDLAAFHLSEEEEKRIRKAFRNPEKTPKILIVTEKLLTGFDAPILYCMYLDKPMRDHVLLQAIARVNRPYENENGKPKTCGFVLDFVGIFDKLEKALAFDSKDIEGVVRDLEVLKARFSSLMENARSSYLTIPEGKTRDKAVEAVLAHFLEEGVRTEFYKFFQEVSDIYDILSPDAYLRPYIDDVERLARMYRMIRESYDAGVIVDREFSRKTAELVMRHTTSTEIGVPTEISEINADTVRIIEESKKSDIEKIFNMLKSIQKTVHHHEGESPYLIQIGEKAELIARAFKDRQANTLETLDELKKIVSEINTARHEQQERGMSIESFSIYWILKKEKIDRAEDLAHQMNGFLTQYPYWSGSEKHEREVKKEFYRVLYESGQKDMRHVKDIVNNLLLILRQARR